jgi:gluconokinase
METTTHKLIVMGVSGCGKSTLGAGVALALGCRLIEGDDFHFPESQAKMRQGIPLQDSDRELWLDRVGQPSPKARAGRATCSALKRRYHNRLRAGADFCFVFATSPKRMRPSCALRPDHLFPASLVASQFADLESPVGEPGVLRVDAALRPQAQLDAVIDWLARPAIIE